MKQIISSSTPFGHFFKCPHSHHLYTYEGIVNKASNENLLFGTSIHEGIELLMDGFNLDAAICQFSKTVEGIEGETLDGVPRKKELWWMGSNLLQAAHDYALPSLLAQYRIKCIEQEYAIPLPLGAAQPLVVWATRPDATLERIEDGVCFNCNIKTGSYVPDIKKAYEYSVQMLMEALAIKLNQGLETGGTVIFALNKGQKGKPNKGDIAKGKKGYRQDSPFTYVWWKNGTWSFNWAAGSEKLGVWEFNSTPREWYDKLPEETKKAQVEISTPIEHARDMDIMEVTKDILKVETAVAGGFHPKAYESCNSYGTYNRPCDYYLWCHGTDQERQDNFIKRDANHPLELTMMEDF